MYRKKGKVQETKRIVFTNETSKNKKIVYVDKKNSNRQILSSLYYRWTGRPSNLQRLLCALKEEVIDEPRSYVHFFFVSLLLLDKEL